MITKEQVKELKKGQTIYYQYGSGEPRPSIISAITRKRICCESNKTSWNRFFNEKEWQFLFLSKLEAWEGMANKSDKQLEYLDHKKNNEISWRQNIQAKINELKVADDK
jgi:organic radical activating enzyme